MCYVSYASKNLVLNSLAGLGSQDTHLLVHGFGQADVNHAFFSLLRISGFNIPPFRRRRFVTNITPLEKQI